MRHLKDTERSLIALALLQSATRWLDLAANLQGHAPLVTDTLRRQAANARALSDEVVAATGMVML